MVQKIVSFILICLGVVVVAGGIASATVFKPDSQVSLTTGPMAESPYVVVHAPVLALVDNNVTINATAPGDSEMALILGRTVDVEGWLAGHDYYAVTGLTDWETLTAQKIAASETPPDTDETPEDSNTTSPDEDADATDESDAERPNSLEQTQSDMWISYASGSGTQTITLENIDDNVSLLAVSTSADSGAPAIQAQWTRDVTAPLLVPAIVAGVVISLLGVALLLVTLRRGPKRKERSSLTDTTEEATEAVAGAWTGTSVSDPQPVGAATAGNTTFAPASPVPPIKPPASASSGGRGFNAEESSESAPSVASAATVARVLAAEPDLNTGELQKLGLTRRQLREMHQAQAARNSSPTTLPAPNPAAAAQANNAASAQPAAPQSRATASNWRAAWGVGATGEPSAPTEQEQNVNPVQPQTAIEHRSPSYANSGPAVDRATGHAQRNLTYPSPGTNPGQDSQTALNPAQQRTESVYPRGATVNNNAAVTPASPQIHGVVPQPVDRSAGAQEPKPPVPPVVGTERDVRQPASWWGGEEGTDTPRRPRHGSAPSAQTTASSHSAAEAFSARSAASSNAPTAHRSEAPATRRALYSSYRAEAERLSEEEDWPVPAPDRENEARPTEGEK